MFQGFYDLTSNMITQNRNLNIISNNMSNVSTPGFKMDRLMQSTFRDEMIYRYDKYGKTAVGTVSRMNIGDERITDYTEGGIRETGASMDVGLIGSGFFEIQTDNGMVYTRNGSFNLDIWFCRDSEECREPMVRSGLRRMRSRSMRRAILPEQRTDSISEGSG